MKKLILTISFLIFSVINFSQHTDWAETEDNKSIAYSIQGKGEITLIFVHGWCCNKEFWKYQIPYFKNEYSTVVIDLAGFGQSQSRTKHSFNHWGNDILAVVNKLNPEKYILIGHSSGGYAVLNAATKADSRLLGIIGVDSYRGTLEKQYDKLFIKKAENNSRLPKDEFKKSMRDIDRWFVKSSNPEVIKWIKSQTEDCDMETAAQGVREYYKYRNNTDTEFKRVKCKIFGINKEKSKFDLPFFEKHKIKFKGNYIKNVGHFVMMDDSETFNKLLKDIIIEITKH